MYDKDSFGIEGFRAFNNVRLKPVFQAAAAMLMGVFGVTGVFSCEDCMLESLSKGSDWRNACLVDVTMEAILEDLRIGKVLGEFVGSWVDGIVEDRCELSEVMDVIESRRSAEG